MTPLKAAVLVTIAFMLCMTAIGVAHADPRESIYRLGGPTGTGTGVMVAPGFMVTAAHVVESGDMMVDTGRGVTDMEVIYADQFNDLAVLKVELDCPCATLAEAQPVITSAVMAVGFPIGLPHRVFTMGFIQAVDTADGTILHTANTVGGMSGGGLFNRAGRLVGLNQATSMDCSGWVNYDDYESGSASACVRVTWLAWASSLMNLKAAILLAADSIDSAELAAVVWDSE